MFAYFNPSPNGSKVGDCVIRAICAVENKDWNSVFCELAVQGYAQKDMPSSNAVWGEYLKSIGYKRHFVGDDCPLCYTVKDFAESHPVGAYVIGTGTHAVAVINGAILDNWNSENEPVLYYWQKYNI